jgi:hypothetical protein
LAFDYSLCSNVITVPAPYPDSETGASDAAAAAVRNIFEALVSLVDCEAGRAAYITAATAYMRTFDAGYANPAALGAIFDAYCADPDAGNQYKTDCPYSDHKDDIEGCTGSDGLMDWLNCLSDKISDWLDDTSDALMDALNQAARALSGNGWQNAGAGGAGGGAGFGGVGETIVYDYTDNDGGMVTIDTDYYGGDSGEWFAGLGWGCHIHSTGSGYSLNIAKADFIPSGKHVTGARITFVQAYGGSETTVYLTSYPLTPSYDTLIDATGTYTGEQHASFTGDEDTRGLSFFVRHFGISTDFYLTRLEIDLSC